MIAVRYSLLLFNIQYNMFIEQIQKECKHATNVDTLLTLHCTTIILQVNKKQKQTSKE